MKMNEEIKTKWLEALRSGRYQQGKSVLRGPDDRYCCLGVLCDVIDSSGWVQQSPGSFYDYGPARDAVYLPGPIAVEARLGEEVQRSLANMNDIGYTFDRIADRIEENL